MIIKKVRLVNYRQYADRTVEIDGTLVAVTGRNGHGKSNFLKGIQYALTGEIPGAVKADLLKWGETSGYVELWFEHDGRDGHVKRSVSDNKVTLDYDGTTVSGITNVATELRERLGVDKDILRQAVFVAQKEVDAVISAKTDKRERETAFQRLLGIDAAKTHKALTEWVSANASPANYDIQLAEAEKQLDALSARSSELSAQVDASLARRAEATDVDRAEAERLERVRTAIGALGTVVRRRDAAVERLRDADARLAAELARPPVSDTTLTDPGVDMKVVTQEIAALEDARRAAERHAACVAARADAARRLEEIDAQPHASATEVAAAVQEYAARCDELSAVRAEIDTRERTLALLEDDASCVCPVCASKMDPQATRQAISGALADLESRRDALGYACQAAYDRESSLQVSCTAWKARRDAAAEALAEAEKALASSVDPGISADAVASGIAERRIALDAQAAYAAEVARHRDALARRAAAEAAARATVDTLRAERDAAETAVSAARDELAAAADDARLPGDDAQTLLPTVEARLAEIAARRSELAAMDRDIAAFRAAHAEVVRTVDGLRASIETLRASKDRQDRHDAAVAVIDRVRDWFHYVNGPRVLTLQVLEAMTVDVNRYLGNFTAPFVVTPDPDSLGFRVLFTDGRATPETPPTTDVLSGGEQVQLAVAFRLAIYTMFAGKLGLLSLDEPTAYLDDGNVDRFGVLLSQVRQIAKSMRVQVFMATHERSVLPHMYAVVDLD